MSISCLLKWPRPNQTAQFRLSVALLPIANCHAGRRTAIDESELAIVIRAEKRDIQLSDWAAARYFPWAHRSTVVLQTTKSENSFDTPRRLHLCFVYTRGATQEGTRAHKAQSQTRQSPCSAPDIVRVPHITLPAFQDTGRSTLQHAYVHLPICSFPYYRHAQMMASIQYCPANLIA